MLKSPNPSRKVQYKIYLHKEMLPLTFLPGFKFFCIHSQKPSRKWNHDYKNSGRQNMYSSKLGTGSFFTINQKYQQNFINVYILETSLMIGDFLFI